MTTKYQLDSNEQRFLTINTTRTLPVSTSQLFQMITPNAIQNTAIERTLSLQKKV